MKSITMIMAAVLTASFAHGNGTRLPYQDMEAVARGYAFAATADNPSAIYYNPAGMAQLREGALEAGLCLIRPESRFTAANGRVAEARTRTFDLPFLFAAQPLPVGTETPVVVGAAAYAPFGLGSEWGENSGFRTLATRNALAFRRYALSLSGRVAPGLMVGGALQYNRVHVDVNRGIGLAPRDRINFTGRGETWSYNLGALYQPTPQHSFGVQYQSTTRFSIAGTTSYDPIGFGEPSSTRWPFPSNYTLSYSFRPDRHWNLEIGYDRTRWSTLGTLTLNRALSGPLPLVFAWKDSTYYEFGGTYSWDNGWQLSAGGCWSGNSVPTATFNPTVVDYDRWLWNSGIAYRLGRVKIATLLQYSPRTTRTVAGSLRSPVGESADGTYENRLLAAGVQVVTRW